MDVPYNYYVPDGKNSRLLDRTDRVEFDRETLDGNTGFQLKIPYLEHAFGTKYFVMDHVTVLYNCYVQLLVLLIKDRQTSFNFQ